jgi:hypothetical protein
MSKAPPVLRLCELCGDPHQMGPDRYDGEVLSRYQMEVCHRCLRAHSKGLPRALESRLIAHLEEHGIPLPERNPKGLFPLESEE